MTRLEGEIRSKLALAQEVLLNGGAKDYSEYMFAVSRYRVLKELVDDLEDLKKSVDAGDEKPDD